METEVTYACPLKCSSPCLVAVRSHFPNCGCFRAVIPVSAGSSTTLNVSKGTLPRLWTLIVNEDGTDDIALMNAAIKDQQTGQMVALNDLSTGRYDVTVDVGPSYTARRDATVAALTSVLNTMVPQDPEAGIIRGLIMDNQSVWRATGAPAIHASV
ncbi:hypothetical protein SMX06_004069 [Cronobacter sakazakii]|nr:hypothetical protein [Cronobacter sakazakii]